MFARNTHLLNTQDSVHIRGLHYLCWFLWTPPKGSLRLTSFSTKTRPIPVAWRLPAYNKCDQLFMSLTKSSLEAMLATKQASGY